MASNLPLCPQGLTALLVHFDPEVSHIIKSRQRDASYDFIILDFLRWHHMSSRTAYFQLHWVDLVCKPDNSDHERSSVHVNVFHIAYLWAG